MRVIVRRCHRLASHFLCPSCRLSHYGFPHLRPIAIPAPRLARGFTNSGSLAAWSWNTSTTPKPKANDHAQESVSEPQKEASPVNEPPRSGIFLGRKDVDPEVLRKEFYLTLETGQPDQVMTAMLDYDCEHLVATMPQTVWIEALHLLSPAYFIEPYKELYRPMHPYHVERKQYRGEHSTFDDFVRNLSDIIQIRLSAGHTLGLAECTHLLDCARSVGDALMADHIWHTMKRDGIVPDVQCYNHYMGAKVWNGAHTGQEKYRLRMTPFAYRKRRFQEVGWRGYGTAGHSVRVEVRHIYNEMTEAGSEGDETTVVNLLMAAARVGDRRAMETILVTFWNVDVEALKKGFIDNVTKYDRTSPFYPSGQLLIALAHTFGTNNDMDAAVKAIEHFSKNYDIEVPETVWTQLFEWAFVLSRPRSGPEPERSRKLLGSDVATFPFVQRLFDTMTSEYLNVKPTVEMHTKLAKTAWVCRRLEPFLYHMRAAYKIMDKTRRKSIAAREMVESYLRYPRSNGTDMDISILRSKGFADAVHAYDILRFQVLQQTCMIERLARLLVYKFRRRWRVPEGTHWQTQWLPQVIEEWRDFLPQFLRYPMRTGEVKLLGLTTWVHPRFTTHQGLQVRQPSLNDDFIPDKATLEELNDDAIWTYYKSNMSRLDLSNPVLKRLFDPVIVDYDHYSGDPDFEDEEAFVNPAISKLILDPGEEVYVPSFHLVRWRERAAESYNRKELALRRAFGPLPGEDEDGEGEGEGEADGENTGENTILAPT
ncbi:uncharacterized protein BDV17DRAFT_257548 [Aspergillus undulatus]|uniref:uncharacterized protein n=1 Tax=Aspergillus undulatus TaxID=1810928 RepID=UPI003CCDBC43